MKGQQFGSSMGEMTVEQCSEGWVVCEDGKRVGGTVRCPFESQEAAQQYIDDETAYEHEIMAEGKVGESAIRRVIRNTDPEVWAKFETIDSRLAADISIDDRLAAHQDAGTLNIAEEIIGASAEAKGILERIGEIDGRPVFMVKGQN